MSNHKHSCGTNTHFNRRTLLKAGGLSGLCWLTPLATALSRADEESLKSPSSRKKRKRPKSVILLWLEGGPSQLETFDPHPGTRIGGDTKAIQTNVKGIQLAESLPKVAEQMDSLAIVRSLKSKEGDHERAVYNIKTGFRPDPTLVHPAIGSVICHQLPGEKSVEIPHHISILPTGAPGRGGYLGDEFDAFKLGDPQGPLPDMRKRVPDSRFKSRMDSLKNIAEAEFARGRKSFPRNGRSLGILDTAKSAETMMASEQLKAFDLSKVPAALKTEFGDTPFGRACIAAMQLVEVGARCVEVTLNGWDSHANNHDIQMGRAKILDSAFAALISNLKERGLYDDTIVICGGEFGRTPIINPASGRDHWPHGFSIALGGGGIRTGQVIGETSPTPKTDKKTQGTDVVDPYQVEDIHATVLDLLGVDFTQMLDTPVGRPMAISEGKVIKKLLA